MAEGGRDLDEDIHDDYDVFEPGDDMRESIPRRQSLMGELIKPKVRSFYESLGQEPPDIIDPNEFELDARNHLFFRTDGDPVQLTTKPDPTKFLKRSTLKQRLSINEQNRLGIRAASNPDPDLRSQAISKLQNTLADIPDAQYIPLQDLSQSAQEISEQLEETILGDDDQTALKTIDDSPLPMREIMGLNERLQSIRGELTNNLAKLSELDEHIEKEKVKLATADDGNLGQYVKDRILQHLNELQEERATRLEVLSENRHQLRTQINRIRETIHTLLYENTTLLERIQTLFREQGITIASILTAIGFAISTLVYALTGSGAAGSGGGGASGGGGGGSESKSWVRKQFEHLQNLLKKLADKVVDALPGIIGSVVSWILSTAGKVIGYVGEHLWIAAIGLGVLLLRKVKIN